MKKSKKNLIRKVEASKSSVSGDGKKNDVFEKKEIPTESLDVISLNNIKLIDAGAEILEKPLIRKRESGKGLTLGSGRKCGVLEEKKPHNRGETFYERGRERER